MNEICVSREELTPGYKLPAFSLGPFSEEEVLRMAWLSRDFHPLHMVRRVAGEAGYRSLPLHGQWVSGLAAAGLRGLFPDGEVARLSIRYREQVFQRDRLRLDVICLAAADGKGLADFTFEVTTQDGAVVADGSARIQLPESARATAELAMGYGT